MLNLASKPADMTSWDWYESQGILWIYDLSIDDIRPATQKDIDALGVVALAYGMLKAELLSSVEKVTQRERESNPYSPQFIPIEERCARDKAKADHERESILRSADRVRKQDL